MLAKYPTPKAWRKVRFIDECHLGFGPQGRVYVTRRPGESTCLDCLQLEYEPKGEDEKKVHCWAVVGYKFKSLLYFYDAENSNGAMTIAVYLLILKEEVSQWLKDWVLEEDRASRHSRGQNSPITKWKVANGIT